MSRRITGHLRIHLCKILVNGDYDRIKDGDMLIVEDVQGVLGKVVDVVNVRNVTQGTVYAVKCDLKARQRAIVQAGGLLNYTKMGSKVS